VVSFPYCNVNVFFAYQIAHVLVTISCCKVRPHRHGLFSRSCLRSRLPWWFRD